MTKLNKRGVRPAVQGPLQTASATPNTRTYNGAPAFTRETKSELFQLAVSNLVGEDTFYEKAGDRDNRYMQLVHSVAVADPKWTAQFLRWLRSEGNMRSASIVGAAEAVKAMTAANIAGGRQIVASVLQRADEPGELLGYWTSQYGRAIPKPIKRGVSDAIGRLYNEYNLLKYDTASHGYRFADVIDLVHPDAVAPWQGDLFKHALDRRHGRDTDWMDRGNLPMLRANAVVRAQAAEDNWQVLLSSETLKLAGMTWEDALSLAGSKVDKAKLWEALAPTMGYMALLRNLRNFDEAGMSEEAATAVAARLADPAQVAKSRQFPFRFLAAYENITNDRWKVALGKALDASLSNLPTLDGRSLVLVDTSGSMTSGRLSAKSTMTPAKAAAVFGVALAAKGEADLWGWADGQFQQNVPKGASVLAQVKKFTDRNGEVGHGTQLFAAMSATFRKGVHKRVFVISDMQTVDHRTQSQDGTMIYAFVLNGYAGTPLKTSATVHELGGLGDATFRLVPLLEAGKSGNWDAIFGTVS